MLAQQQTTKTPYTRFGKVEDKATQKGEDITIECKKNGIVVRVIKLYTDKDKTIVLETELRHDRKTDKFNQYPVHFNVHKKYSYAHSEFVGRVAVAAMENANTDTDPNNMFIRSMYTDRPVV